MAEQGIDAAVRSQIIAALGAGASRDAAARYSGITEADLLAEAGADDEFRAAIIAAEAKTEIAAITAVGLAARAGDWRAGLALLDRQRERAPIGAALACGAHKVQCPDCRCRWVKCPHDHDTADCLVAAHGCSQPKGMRTNHPRRGRCWKHGGRTPNGIKFAQRVVAAAILADLAVPVSGDPLLVLQAALDSAYGVMLGAQRMLADTTAGVEFTAPAVEARLRVYVDGIERAGRMAKLAAEALNDDALVKLDMKAGEIIHRILLAGLDAHDRAGGGQDGRRAAEDAITRELVAVGPSADERN